MQARLLLASLALAWSVPADAHAERPPAAPDGTVVQLEGDIIYFDVGDTRVHPGGAVRVLRTISARHPVTGETLTDHFPLGLANVLDAGRVLSYARLERPIVGMVKVGDVVRVGPQPPAAQTVVTAPQPAASEIARVWNLTLGKTPSERVRILTEYLRAHPDSPYVESVTREIGAFKSIDIALQQAAREREQRTVIVRKSAALEIHGSLPERLYAGDPLEIAIHVVAADRVQAAFAYFRRPEAITYQRVRLAPDGDGYFRAFAPVELIEPPEVAVFVEVIDAQGRAVTAGDEAHPSHVEVDVIPGGPIVAGPGHSAVRGFFEFVDFNRFRGNDYYFVTESDFTYHVNDWLTSVSTGFGVLYGRGGNVSDMDDKQGNALSPCASDGDLQTPACGHPVGFNYGYVEAELAAGRYVGFVGRVLGGHTVQGIGVGAELRMRIGPSTGTNLQIGGNVMSNLGALAMLALQWNVIRDWPMQVSVSVTNQPAEADLGWRLVYSIGYRAKPWLYPTLRIGYDARNVTHAGPSFGLGLVLSW